MATHFSVLAWRIPWTEEPGGLQVHRVIKSETQLKRFSVQAPMYVYSDLKLTIIM